MQVVLLFDENSAAHQHYAAYTARQAVLGSGVLQASGRLIVIRAGTILLGHAQRAQRDSIIEEAFFGDSWRLVQNPTKLRKTSQESEIFAWVVNNVDKSTATKLHRALSSEKSYIGVLSVNLATPSHLKLYRLALPLLMRISGLSCRLFFRAFEEDECDMEDFRHVRSLGFNDVEYEDIGVRGTIFDDFDTLDHFSRVESLREFLSGALSGGADAADELLVMLEDLSPRLAATLGTAARSFLHAISEEDHAQVGLSARRYIQQLADAIYPPRDEMVSGRDVTADKVKNRLWAYVEQQLGGSDIIHIPRIQDLGGRVDLLVSQTNEAVHAGVSRHHVRGVLVDLAVLSVCLLSLAPRENRKAYLAYAPRVTEILNEWLQPSAG